MADKNRRTASDEALALAGQTEGASLDKVRDILFGNQMREVERKLSRLEERLLRESGELRAEMRSRLEALETYVRKEDEALSERLRSESRSRSENSDELARKIEALAKSLERSGSEIEEQVNKVNSNLQNQLLEQAKTLAGDLKRTQDEMVTALDRLARELRGDKVDRSAIAQLFLEAAMRFSQESTEEDLIDTEE
jgi:methyl-accepting chemotaxis protein